MGPKKDIKSQVTKPVTKGKKTDESKKVPSPPKATGEKEMGTYSPL